MKVIELGQTHASLEELADQAQNELIVLRKADGSVFALSHVDEFAVEVELLKHNPEFMALLRRLSKEPATISLEDLRQELAS